LARIKIKSHSVFANHNVGFVEDTYHLNVVLLRRNQHSEMHPTDKQMLYEGDTIAVLGGPEQLNNLIQANESR
jgi:uncharacterized protein with PhoU and TrkA domain